LRRVTWGGRAVDAAPGGGSMGGDRRRRERERCGDASRPEEQLP